IAGHNAFLATYGTFRLEVTPRSYIYKQGSPAEFTVRAMDYDKHPVKTAIHLSASRYWWASRGDHEEKTADKDAQTDADGFAHVTMALNSWGSHTVRVTAQTPIGREVNASTWVWVSSQEETWADGEARTLKIVADKTSYKVGDVAHILVAGTFP